MQVTDGRKTVGGKLEVKIRIRDPFKSKQVEETKEKWLVIDQFFKTIDKVQFNSRLLVSEKKLKWNLPLCHKFYTMIS